MFGLFIFLFFILPILKGSKKDERRSEGFKIFLTIYILFAIFGSLLDSPMGIVAVIALIIYAWNKYKKKQEADERTKEYSGGSVYYGSGEKKQSRYSKSDAKAAKVMSAILPRQVAKRRKIVQDFNKKYKLYLTEEQINGIVDSTYMSETWKREVEAMAGRYESIYEWFQGNTRWLRAYLYAFHVQDVTSDMEQQEKIVTAAFEEIMKYSDTLSYLSVPERINEINSKYYTGFDDVSYMIAYRFLEAKGLFHTLDVTPLNHDDSELDDLMKKYQSTPAS